MFDTATAFTSEMSPALTLIDVQGGRHVIAGLDRAAAAIDHADRLQLLSGAGHVGHTRHTGNVLADPLNAEPILLYFIPDEGADLPGEGRIPRIAKVLSRSEVRGSTIRGHKFAATGQRAVVFPSKPNPANGRLCFLISPIVWYNQNRGSVFGINGEEEPNFLLDDINARLLQKDFRGTVSLPR